jgi:hypothetical protein
MQWDHENSSAAFLQNNRLIGGTIPLGELSSTTQFLMKIYTRYAKNTDAEISKVYRKLWSEVQ